MVLSMINDTILGFINTVTAPSIPWWIGALAIIGGLAVFSTAAKYTADVIQLIAYLIGLIKFIYLKLKKRDV